MGRGVLPPMLARWTSSLALALALALAAPAAADVLTLRDGGRLEGDVAREGERYRVRLPSGAWVEVPAADVLALEEGRTHRDEYIRRVNTIDPTDAEGLYRLALFCREHRLEQEAEMALRTALRAVPDHEGARAALGEVLFEGRWMPLAEVLERRGLVRHGALWVTPEEKAALVWKERVRACAAEVRRLGVRVRSPEPATRAEAERLMGALDDPAALDPLLEASGHWHPAVRRASLPALARRAGEEEERVARRLAQVAAGDPELDIQDRAADLIRERRIARGAEELLRLYACADAAPTRRAAAHALGRIRWKGAFEPLLATLVFRVRRERMVPVPYWTPAVLPVSRHAADALGIRRRLVNGYRLQPCEVRVVDDFAWNDAARTGLRGITGEDFHFDATGWWNWWVARADGFGPWMEPVAAQGGAGAARPAAGPGA